MRKKIPEKINAKIVTAIVDDIWETIQNLSNIKIRHIMDKESGDEDSLFQMAEAPLIELNWLAKFAIDYSSVQDFKKFIETIDSIEWFQSPEYDKYHRRVEEQQIHPLRKKLWVSRNTCLMGLGGWVIERLRDKTLCDVSLAKEMLGQIRIPFDSFLDVVFHPKDKHERFTFGWDNWHWKWEDIKRSPIKPQQMRLGGIPWRHYYFFIEAIKNSDKETLWQEIDFEAPAATGVHFFIEELLQGLNRICGEEFFEELMNSTPQNINNGIERIKKHFVQIEKSAETKEKVWITKQEIDEKRIMEAKDNFTKGFLEYATLRHVIQHEREVEIVSEWESEEKFFLGFWAFRNSYVKGSTVSGVDSFWRSVGADFASSESSEILLQLLSNISMTSFESMTNTQLIEKISIILHEMRNKSIEPSAIIMLDDIFDDYQSEHKFFYQNDYFTQISEEEKKFPNQRGVLCGVPLIYRLGKKKVEPSILILSSEKIYLKNMLLGEGYEKLFRIEFDFMNDEKARQVLAENKDWLIDKKTGRKRTEQEALLEIQQKVWVKIYEQFKVTVDDLGALRGFKVRVKEKED